MAKRMMTQLIKLGHLPSVGAGLVLAPSDGIKLSYSVAEASSPAFEPQKVLLLTHLPFICYLVYLPRKEASVQLFTTEHI